MKFSKWYFVTRCVLYALLGVAMAKAGLHVPTWRYFSVLGLVAAIDLSTYVHGLCAAHRAFKAGQVDIAEFVARKGWRV